MILQRTTQNDVCSMGILSNDVAFSVKTIELPWRDNQDFISCIPAAIYVCRRSFYHRGGYEVFEIVNVPNRDDIKIHVANFPKDVLGCIGVGMEFGENMVTRSREAFGRFMKHTAGMEEFQLEIRDP